MKRVIWWPARTRRERWIYRFGYVVGVVTGGLHVYRLMRDGQHG